MSDVTNGKVRKGYVRGLDIKNGRVDMSHGSGGGRGGALDREVVAPAIDND